MIEQIVDMKNGRKVTTLGMRGEIVGLTYPTPVNQNEYFEVKYEIHNYSDVDTEFYSYIADGSTMICNPRDERVSAGETSSQIICPIFGGITNPVEWTLTLGHQEADVGICSFIDSLGGADYITALHLYWLILSWYDNVEFQFEGNYWGFIPTAMQLYGCLLYWDNTDGDFATGCDYY